MTTDQIIALAASVGSCMAAVATFLTVREVARQRLWSYRPELVLSRTSFEARSSSENTLPDNWVHRNDNMDRSADIDFPVPIDNIGLGAANNVLICWSFPIEEAVATINEMAQRALVPLYFELKSGMVSIHSTDKLLQMTSVWINQQKQAVDYILPAAYRAAPTMIKLPHAYMMLASAQIYLFQKDKIESIEFPTLPLLNVAIEYMDIAGRKHRTSFNIKLVFTMMSSDKSWGYLEPSKARR